jgi:hypothetical protein
LPPFSFLGQRLARAGAQGGVTLADPEPRLAEMPRPVLFFLARAKFQVGFFFIFSEREHTRSYMPFLREPPLLARYPVSKLCKTEPFEQRLTFKYIERDTGQLLSQAGDKEFGTSVNKLV